MAPRALALLSSLLLLAACSAMPKTADDAFARSRVVPQPEGGQLFIGPEIPFTVRGERGVARFQAMQEGGRVRYFQSTSLGLREDAGTFEVSRAQMEQYRQRGASLAVQDSGVHVNFTAAYVDGFLRRVDTGAARR